MKIYSSSLLMRSLAVAAVWTITAICPTRSAALERNVSTDCSRGGMVATSCPEATAVGVAILEAGGNAIDAAVATGFALAVTWPSAGNIGGGGFMTARTTSGDLFFIDFREKAPKAASRDMYLDGEGEVVPGLSTRGHRACGVPGSVAGLYKAWKMYGSMPWADLLAPSIELAENGFRISSHLSQSFLKLNAYREEFPSLGKFLGKDGSDLETGDPLIQPDLAEVLRIIAEKGEDGFYGGRVASLIVDEMEKGGGLITLEDLHDYRAVVRDPLVGDYRGYEVVSAPPPSSGGIVLLEILNMLEASGFRTLPEESALALHLMIEAEKRAYHDRAVLLGDPDFVEIPVSRLISKEYAGHLIKSIGDEATPSKTIGDAGTILIESEETTHYSIIDQRGNVVAVTTTLNGSFGNKVVVTGGGFLLNNEMDDFSSKPGVPNIYGLVGGEANAIAPGKRMLSSMTPTIVLKDGRPFLVLGSPGGSTIITTVAQIMVNMIDFGMNAQEAVSAPRYHHQWSPDIVYYEEGIGEPGMISALEGMGHKVKSRSPIGDAQVISIDQAGRCGVSDPRHGGRSKGTKDGK